MKTRMAGHIAAVGHTNNEYKYLWSEEKIPFGAGIMRGTNPETQCKLMTTGGSFIGVALFYQKNNNDAQDYGAKTTVETLQRGQVWVEVTTDILAGDKVGCGNNGKFAKAGTAGYDNIEAIFETSATAGNYAILKLR